MRILSQKLGLLALLLLGGLLPLHADQKAGIRVPAGTATGQTLHWDSTAYGGLGAWVLDTTFLSEPANTIHAGPVSGSDGAATFRALVPADLPVATPSALGAVSVGTGLSISGSGVLSETIPLGAAPAAMYTLRYNAANTLINTSSQMSNGTQVSFNGTGGPVTTSRVSVGTSSTAENGVTTTMVSASTGFAYQAFLNATQTWGVFANGHMKSAGTIPTIAAGANASAAAVTAGGTDTRGLITATAVASGGAAATKICSVTFAAAYASAPQGISLTPGNAATYAAGVYYQNVSTTGFDVYTNSAPAASAALALSYTVIQ